MSPEQEKTMSIVLLG